MKAHVKCFAKLKHKCFETPVDTLAHQAVTVLLNAPTDLDNLLFVQETQLRPKLKGSVGEGSNHSNFPHQSSVEILSKFDAFC